MVPVSLEYGDAGDASNVCIAGTWTDWTPTPMLKREGQNTWVYVAHLDAGSTVDFKFVVDGEWKTCDKYGLSNDGHGANNNCIYVTRPLPPPTTTPSDGISVTSVDPTTTITATTGVKSIAENSNDADQSNLVERLSDEMGGGLDSIYEEVAEEGKLDADGTSNSDHETVAFSGEVTSDYADSADTDHMYADASDSSKAKSQSAKSGPPSSVGYVSNEEEAEGIGFASGVKGDKVGCVLF